MAYRVMVRKGRMDQRSRLMDNARMPGLRSHHYGLELMA
jgi:hypothetical protein